MATILTDNTVTYPDGSSTVRTITYSDGGQSVQYTPGPNTPAANEQTIRDQAQAAFTANRIYVALAAPNAAQTTAQVKALSRQMNAVLRLLLNQFEGTD